MTVDNKGDKDPKDDEIPVATAVQPDTKSSGVPVGHSRYYCSKCQAVSDFNALYDRCKQF